MSADRLVVGEADIREQGSLGRTALGSSLGTFRVLSEGGACRHTQKPVLAKLLDLMCKPLLCGGRGQWGSIPKVCSLDS